MINMRIIPSEELIRKRPETFELDTAQFIRQYGIIKENRQKRKFLIPSLTDDIADIKNSLKSLLAAHEELKSGVESYALGKGSGDMSEDLLQKVHSIDNRLTRTETLVEQISIKLDKMDSKLDTLATKDFVENTVNRSDTSMMRWIIGTGIAVSVVVLGIITLFFNLYL